MVFDLFAKTRKVGENQRENRTWWCVLSSNFFLYHCF